LVASIAGTFHEECKNSGVPATDQQRVSIGPEKDQGMDPAALFVHNVREERTKMEAAK